MKLRWIVILTCVVATPAAAGRKFGKQVRFAGIHPVAKAEGGGVCYIEAPHVHVYPANKLEYRVHADNNVFVGDPVAYGWDGPKYAYKGHHPVHVHAIVGESEPYVHYCYLDGPHYHGWEPPEGPEFKVVGDAYFYVAEPPPLYLEARPAYVAINATYRPLVYTRPVIEVAPPAGWIGARVDIVAPGVVVETPAGPGRAEVRGPGVGVRVSGEVHIPVPTISVGVGVKVGAPAVIVKEKHKVKRGKYKHKKYKRR